MEDILESEYQIYKSITFISEEQINPENWQFAYKLVSGIDVKDTAYIAYTKQFKCKLWTGDKKLITGLEKKNYHNLLSTDNLFELRRSQK